MSFKISKYVHIPTTRLILCFSHWSIYTNRMSLIYQASAFVITYPVNNAVNEVGNENGKAVAWEKAFIQLVKVLTIITDL